MHIRNISAKTIHLECADLLVIPECRQPRKQALITAAATTKANGSISTERARVSVRAREKERKRKQCEQQRHTLNSKNGNRQAPNTWSDSVTTIELIGMVLNQLLHNKLCRSIRNRMKITYRLGLLCETACNNESVHRRE